MVMVDALEKAKRLRKEREEAERRGGGSYEPGSHAAARRPAPARSRPEPGARVGEPLEFPLQAYNVAECNQNRVLVPDAEAELVRKASASFRLLRTRVLQRCRSNGWTALAVTSATPGDGKTCTALNLAISLAREGNQDVFLIDCDMRNPSVCRYLGVAPRAEIRDFFVGTVQAQDLLFSIGIERLAIAGGALGNEDASELLSNGKLEALLGEIRQLSSNPLILLDLPPLISTDDALVVAPRADGLILVASEGVTRRDQLEKALALVSEYPMAGLVLNRGADAIGTQYYGNY